MRGEAAEVSQGKGADSSEHKEEKLLHRYLTETDATAMQPINANFGLLPPPAKPP